MTQRVGRFVSKISLFKEYSEDTLAAKVREGTGGCMVRCSLILLFCLPTNFYRLYEQ